MDRLVVHYQSKKTQFHNIILPHLFGLKRILVAQCAADNITVETQKYF